MKKLTSDLIAAALWAVLVGMVFDTGCTVHGARHIEGDVFGFHYSFTDRAEKNQEGIDTYTADFTPAWISWFFAPKPKPTGDAKDPAISSGKTRPTVIIESKTPTGDVARIQPAPVVVAPVGTGP